MYRSYDLAVIDERDVGVVGYFLSAEDRLGDDELPRPAIRPVPEGSTNLFIVAVHERF